MAEYKDTTLITVCNACFQASCWQGIFMCDEAVTAGTVDVSVESLRYENLEDESYWEETRVGGT